MPRGSGRHRADPATLARARTALRSRLEARRSEIEEAVLARIYGIADPDDADPIYLEGLRASVSLAIEYALEAIERGEERTSPPPPQLLAQARLAARNGIGLDTILRRYVAGYMLLGEFLVAEAANAGSIGVELLQGRAGLLDRLLVAVSDEYEREVNARARSSQERMAERVERLLAAESIDTTAIAYDFADWHIGMVARGPGGLKAVRALSKRLDRRSLLVSRDEHTVWAWLAGRNRCSSDAIQKALSELLPPDAAVAIGESAAGLAGWRRTHREAVAALPVALREEQKTVRYVDVALVAAALQDDLLVESLFDSYVRPLSERPDGECLVGTLRTYFQAERNISSTAAALAVSRQTVRNRLRLIEELIAKSLPACAIEAELALRLPSSNRQFPQ